VWGLLGPIVMRLRVALVVVLSLFAAAPAWADETPRIRATRVWKELIADMQGKPLKRAAGPKEWVYVYRGIHGTGDYDVNRIFAGGGGEYVGDFKIARDTYAGHADGEGGMVVRFRVPKEFLRLGPKGYLMLSADQLRKVGVSDLRPYVDAVARVPPNFQATAEGAWKVQVGRWQKLDGKSRVIPINPARRPPPPIRPRRS